MKWTNSKSSNEEEYIYINLERADVIRVTKPTEEYLIEIRFGESSLVLRTKDFDDNSIKSLLEIED